MAVSSLPAEVSVNTGALEFGGAFANRGAWQSAADYALGDVVSEGGIRYVCAKGHVSGTFATDLAAERWVSLDAGAGVPLAQAGQTPAQEPPASAASASVGTLAVAARADHVHPALEFGVAQMSDDWWFTNPGYASASFTPTLNALVVAPILIPADIVLSGVGIRVITAASAGGVLRIGIYDAENGIPTNLVYESPTIASTSSGNKTVTGLSVALTGGIYYVGAVAQVAAPVSAQGLSATTSSNFIAYGGATSAGAQFDFVVTGCPVDSTSVTGSLPATFSYGGVAPGYRTWLLA